MSAGCLVVGQPVAAVRNVHLLLADELPVEAVDRAVEHRDVVVGSRTRRAGVRRVVSEVGRELHAALARQVLPRLARLLQRIDGVDEQQRFAVAPGWPDVVQLDVPVGIGGADDARLLRIVDRPRPVRIAAHGERRHAGRVDVPVVVARAVVAEAAVAQQVIPDRLGAGLRNRERIAGARRSPARRRRRWSSRRLRSSRCCRGCAAAPRPCDASDRRRRASSGSA